MQQAAEAHRQLESGNVHERIILTSSSAGGGARGRRPHLALTDATCLALPGNALRREQPWQALPGGRRLRIVSGTTAADGGPPRSARP
jgi:hypothetical protein